jgi:hypothetical protein
MYCAPPSLYHALYSALYFVLTSDESMGTLSYIGHSDQTPTSSSACYDSSAAVHQPAQRGGLTRPSCTVRGE